MTATKEEALVGALDQIAAAFGKDELLTPKQREMRAAMKPHCAECGKKLSRKTARMINGKVMCSSCVFSPMKR